VNFDSAAVLSLFDQIKSHAMKLGLFEETRTHEPKNAPGHGLRVAVWLHTLEPIAAASSLVATSGRVEFHVRVHSSMLQEPQDDIDRDLLIAVSALMGEYSGNFTLGGTVRDVDLLGEHGPPMSAQAGYLDMDHKLYRVMVITLPIIINDLWTQVA